MNTNHTVGRLRFALLAAALLIATIGQSVAASSQIKTQFFILTADGSPSNSACLQNIMSYLDKGEVVGYISTNIAEDPAALDMPHVLRACQIISSPTNLFLWDATNNPTGNFTNQNGSRIGWGLDWSQTNQFLVSSIYFHLLSTEPADALLYTGNLATNTADGTALVFSSTLRGELWDSNGNVIATYYNGETIADHPVNRVIALVREGYYATDMSTVASDLGYFKDEMNFADRAAFTMYDGNGNVIATTTNQMSSVVYVDVPVWSAANNQWYAQIEGQRQLGFTYYLLHTPSLWPTAWTTISGGPEGVFPAGTMYPNSFFEAFESNGVAGASSLASMSVKTAAPTVKVWNN